MDRKRPIHGLPGAFGAAVAVVLAAAALVSCENEKKKYVETAMPLSAQMDRLAVDVEAVAALSADPQKSHEADGRLAAIEGTLKKITTDFTSIMAPVDFAFHHSNMVKALASEATGVSALRGYFGRALSEGVLRARIEDLRQKNAPGDEKKKLESQRVKADLEKLEKEQRTLKNEMDGQLKYYQDNHKFFKAHLRVYKENVK